MEQMKKIFYICLILLAGTNVKAQETKSANGLKLTTQNNELFMEWQDKTATDDTHRLCMGCRSPGKGNL